MKKLMAVLMLVGCGVDAQRQTEPGEEEVAVVQSSLGASTCPGSWLAVPSYDGLSGTYTRTTALPAPAGEMTQVSFAATAGTTMPATGSYSRWVQGSYVLQFGGYSALPDNPAIGAALAFGHTGFPQDGSSPSEVYFVLGLKRNLTGKISALCVLKGGTPFTLQRLF